MTRARPRALNPRETIVMRLPMRIEKLAALGAVAASGGIMLLYLGIAWMVLPHRETGGIDWTQATVTWISVGLVVLALIALHLALAHQLWHAPVHAAEAAGTRKVRDPRDPHHPVAR